MTMTFGISSAGRFILSMRKEGSISTYVSEIFAEQVRDLDQPYSENKQHMLALLEKSQVTSLIPLKLLTVPLPLAKAFSLENMVTQQNCIYDPCFKYVQFAYSMFLL